MKSVTNNDYGFVWGDILVERTCSNDKPKFQVLRVFAVNGEIVEITMRPRSTRVDIIPKEKPHTGPKPE